MFGYFLMGIGGLSVIILVIGFAVVMFIAHSKEFQKKEEKQW